MAVESPCLFLFLSVLSGIIFSYKPLLSLFLFFVSFAFPRKKEYFFICPLFFISGIIFYRNSKLYFEKSLLLQFAKEKREVVLEGTVLEPFRDIGKKRRIKVLVKKLIEKGRVYPLREKIIVDIYGNLPEIAPAERIMFPCRLREFKRSKNPGSFSYEMFMKTRRIVCRGYIPDGRYIVCLGKERKFFEEIRGSIREFLRKELSKRDFSIFSALLLGERSGLEEDTKELLRKSGLGHILAISGLHIGLVAWISFFLIKRLLLFSYRLPLIFDIRKLSSILTCFPVLFYSILSGMSIPTQRAMIMILVYLFSIILERESDVLSSLCLAGLIIVSIHPYSVFSPSFQLSFAAVFGIIWLFPKIRRNTGNKIFSYFSDLFFSSLSIYILLLPLLLYYFHRICLVAPLSNLTAIPILGIWILPFSLASVILFPLSRTISSFLIHISSYGLHLMLFIAKLWSSFPLANIWLFTPKLSEMFIYWLSVLFFTKRHYRISLLLLFLILSEIAFFKIKSKMNKGLRITFLSCPGICAYIEFPEGKSMIFKRGRFSSESTIAPFLWSKKIMKVDYILCDRDEVFIKDVFGAKETIPDNINGVRIKRFREGIELSYKDKRILIKQIPEIYTEKGKEVLKKEFFPVQVIVDNFVEIENLD